MTWQVLEHPTWSFYGRLAYAMYLLHAAVLGIVTGSQGEPWHFTKFLLLTLFVGVTGVTFLGSLPLYLLVSASPDKPILASTLFVTASSFTRARRSLTGHP